MGRLADLDSDGLYALASMRAIADAGIRPEQVDGVLTANSRTRPYQNHAESLAEAIGLPARLTLTFQTGGATTLKMIRLAAWAVERDAASAVLVAAADDLLSGAGRRAIASLAETGYREFERPFLPFAPVTFALLAQRHRHAFGTTAEDLAQVAVAMRRHAVMTPGAHQREPITVEDVLGSPLVASPLRRLDCAPISDGGAAVVVMRAERAPAPRRAVTIAGYGEAHEPSLPYASEPELLASCARATAGALDGAGLALADVGLALIYDPFTIQVLVTLEAIGKCRPGEAAALVRSGGIDVGGELPVNPHGGLLSHGHPGRSGALHHVVEAVRQLRGEALPPERQVERGVALITAEGAMLSDHAALVLSAAGP